MQLFQIHAGGEEKLVCPFSMLEIMERTPKASSLFSETACTFQRYKSDMDSRIDGIIKNNN